MSDPSGWDDELDVLPDTLVEDTSTATNIDGGSNDARLIAERPPHWG
jgi:hypothetical protein